MTLRFASRPRECCPSEPPPRQFATKYPQIPPFLFSCFSKTLHRYSKTIIAGFASKKSVYVNHDYHLSRGLVSRIWPHFAWGWTSYPANKSGSPGLALRVPGPAWQHGVHDGRDVNFPSFMYSLISARPTLNSFSGTLLAIHRGGLRGSRNM